MAAGSRGISRDLLDLKERGAKFYLSEQKSCGQGTPEDAVCLYQLDVAPRAFCGGSPMGQCWGEMPGRQILGWNRSHRLLDGTARAMGVSWRMELCGAA